MRHAPQRTGGWYQRRVLGCATIPHSRTPRPVRAAVKPPRSPPEGKGNSMRVPFIDLSAMTREVSAQVSAGWSALLDSNRFVGGEAVDRFESQWAAYCRAACAVGVAN